MNPLDFVILVRDMQVKLFYFVYKQMQRFSMSKMIDSMLLVELVFVHIQIEQAPIVAVV
jgi:exonuclease I